MMKTEALLLIALMAGVLSAWTLILGLDFIIDEEKKKRGRFLNVIIKVGLCKEKSRPVIILIVLMSLGIIGLIWALTTISKIYTNVSIIGILIITVVLMLVVLYILRRTKKS